jgi:multicomponent Na+:H+ antiporter subunit B
VIVPLDLLLFAILLVTAVLALRAKDLLTAVVLLAAYSLFAALLFTGMSAVDVGLVEGALGAGLTGVLFIAAVLSTTSSTEARTDRRRAWFILPLIGGFVGLMLFASTGLPDRGDPDAPAQLGVSTAYLEGSMEQTETPNVVTALLADYRSQDTLGETLVILTAALAASLVLARRPDHPDEPSEQQEWSEDEPETPAEAHARRTRAADRTDRPADGTDRPADGTDREPGPEGPTEREDGR